MRIYSNQSSTCRRQEHAVILPFNDVPELYPPASHIANPATNPQEVVIASRRTVANPHVDHREPHPLRLQIPIADPELAHVVRPGCLAPNEIMGVVGHPHLIGFGVADSKL
jgi:hypothetical protein